MHLLNYVVYLKYLKRAYAVSAFTLLIRPMLFKNNYFHAS